MASSSTDYTFTVRNRACALEYDRASNELRVTDDGGECRALTLPHGQDAFVASFLATLARDQQAFSGVNDEPAANVPAKRVRLHFGNNSDDDDATSLPQPLYAQATPMSHLRLMKTPTSVAVAEPMWIKFDSYDIYEAHREDLFTDLARTLCAHSPALSRAGCGSLMVNMFSYDTSDVGNVAFVVKSTPIIVVPEATTTTTPRFKLHFAMPPPGAPRKPRPTRRRRPPSHSMCKKLFADDDDSE